VTLIELEAVRAAAEEAGVELDPSGPRRNLVTRGVPLNHLIGRDFRIGEVVLRGVRPCHPCSRLGRFTSTEVKRALVHRGGLRADIVRDGLVRLGDVIEPA
jgi:MOSC domain-containing protein YiiM